MAYCIVLVLQMVNTHKRLGSIPLFPLIFFASIAAIAGIGFVLHKFDLDMIFNK